MRGKKEKEKKREKGTYDVSIVVQIYM